MMRTVLRLTALVAVFSCLIGVVTGDAGQVAVALVQVVLAGAGLEALRRGFGGRVVDAYVGILVVVMVFATWTSGGSASPYLHAYPLLAVVLVFLSGLRHALFAVVCGLATAAGHLALEARGFVPGPVPSPLEPVFLLGLSGVLFSYYPKSRWTHAVEVAQRQQEELATALEEAGAANAAKRRFLANMSHELRTPLNAILGYAELLAEESDDQGQHRDLERISRSGRHLLALIDDVLDLAKVEEGTLVVAAQPVDVVAQVAEVELGLARHLDRHAGPFHVELAPDLGAVRGDPLRIRQILFNLLTNALRFAEGSEVSLTVRREGDDVVFAVVDGGVGIRDSDLERLFRPFEQLDAGVALGDGTGLGLALSQQLAHRMGGRIEVRSVHGEGSTFQLHLPRAPEGTAG